MRSAIAASISSRESSAWMRSEPKPRSFHRSTSSAASLSSST